MGATIKPVLRRYSTPISEKLNKLRDGRPNVNGPKGKIQISIGGTVITGYRHGGVMSPLL